MKAVMLSVRPNWCAKITNKIGIEKNGKPIYEKPVEVRKTRPKIETPFKCFIYETNWSDNTYWKNRHKGKLGKVIGEFVCDAIISHCEMANADIAEYQGCIRREKLFEYANGKELFGWHISDLVIYDKPKELGEFQQCHKCPHTCVSQSKSLCEYHRLKRPPQSWCYVEVQE